MVRFSLFLVAAAAACTGGFQFHSSTASGGGGGGGGGDVDSDAGNAVVTTPHTAGQRYVAMLDKLDDPKPAKNFQYQDDNDRWKYYRQSVAEPWADFKKQLGIADSAPASIDGDSFEADWYAQLKKDAGATLTGPDYWCQKPFNVSAITLDIKYVLTQSKACMASLKSIKAFKCVDDPKQDGVAMFELDKDGTLIFHVHDPHVADSSADFPGIASEYAKIFPSCQKTATRRSETKETTCFVLHARCS